MTFPERLRTIQAAEALLHEQERQMKLSLMSELTYTYNDIIEYGSAGRRSRGIVVDFILWRSFTDAIAVPRIFPVDKTGVRTGAHKPTEIPQYNLKNIKVVRRAKDRW